jgi:bacillithiol biosynthesis cysteine-adding enzyme BshC
LVIFKENRFKVTANDSSSSDTSPADLDELDLLATGRFPPLPEAFLKGKSLELLAPVRFLGPGHEPESEGLLPGPDRRELAEALGRANAHYGHPEAGRLAEQLADPSTRVVITGQQPGLFGGPLYSLSKAVAAQLWAKRLRDAGESAMALFWVATEDHDFRESSRATFFTSEGARTFDLGRDKEPLVPMGLRVLGTEVQQVLAALRQEIVGDRFGSWLEDLEQIYTPDASFGDAFAKLMVHLLGEECPLLVDAMLPELKSAQRPWMRRIVEQRTDLAAAFETRDHQILAKGYPLQVRPQQGASPLFLQHARQRRRIEWRGSSAFRLRGDESFKGEVEDLLEIIENEPQRVSPGVRARSAIQDAVFGTSLQVLGPGELSYLPQAAPVFDLFGIPVPVVALRPQILILDERQRARTAESGLGMKELLDPGFDLDAWLAPTEETGFVESAGERLEDLVEGLRKPSLALDANLERPLKKTAEQMRRALQAYRSKVTAAIARRDDTNRSRLEALRVNCLPQGQLQERVIASAHFPGKYGDRFVEALLQQMRLDPESLHIVTP